MSQKQDQNFTLRNTKYYNKGCGDYNKNYGDQFNTAAQFQPVKCYWDGFHDNGEERWLVEISNGSILTDKHRDYNAKIKALSYKK